ncbi:hypothetical protein DFQ29_008714 [Apophysomyces sp. BC1021]|nr:hypothetical protein DFQ29_008714 [Apophysomyces sp. BC1021]
MLADVFPTKRLGVVMGTVMTSHTVGFAIGPAAGGFLYEYGGFSAPFAFCAGFAVLNFVAILWIAEPLHNKKHAEKTSIKVSRAQEDIEAESPTETSPLLKPREQKLTMLSLIKNWRILSCVLCTAVSSSVFAGIEPALPIHLQQTYNASASTVGLVFVAMVVPAFLSPLIGHLSDNIGRQVISATGMVLMAVVSPLVALNFPSIYYVIPPLMIFGLSSPVTLTPVLPEMGETVNELGGDAYAQGPVVAGVLMSAAGFETLMLVFSGALLVCSPIMMDWVALWHKITAHFRR